MLRVAWEKMMMPSIICSGFRKCGVYSFNPHAIDCSISRDNPEASLLVMVVRMKQKVGSQMVKIVMNKRRVKAQYSQRSKNSSIKGDTRKDMI